LNAKIPKTVSVSNTIYTFSPSFKSSSIVLSHNNKRARQSSTSATRFVLVDQNVGVKNQRISFKIVGLKNWVGIGIGLKNTLKNANYHFNYNNNGHGSYLISSNSFNWSHSHTDQNIKSNSFPFAINDIIDVNLSGNNLTFKKRKNNQSTSLKIKLS